MRQITVYYLHCGVIALNDAEEHWSLGCVVMAAGNARRFGENKLEASLDGQTLIARALRAVPVQKCAAVAVVSQYPEILRLAEESGFLAVENSHPDWGASHTVHLGLEALSSCSAVMFQVSDQPLLEQRSVEALAEFARLHPERITALGHGGVRGNPCVFPRRFYPELLALTGDRGGSAVIRAHPEALVLCEVPAAELTDVDTPDALRSLQKER
jgi:Uncharacterized MobA-related protein